MRLGLHGFENSLKETHLSAPLRLSVTIFQQLCAVLGQSKLQRSNGAFQLVTIQVFQLQRIAEEDTATFFVVEHKRSMCTIVRFIWRRRLKKSRRCCMIPDNPKGISKLRFWGKNCKINGISELAAFMQQRLLKAKHNRSAKDKRVLREQVQANRRLYRAMLLRDDFMDLYTYKSETWAKKFLRGWLRRAMSSRIEPVKRAAKMIPQALRWRHRVGHVETQQRPTRRNEQQNPAAEPPQLWTPLCRGSHQSRLPKLWRSHPREDPLKRQERHYVYVVENYYCK